jgi:Zn-dependent protease
MFLIICFPLFMISITLHEFAHGYVAFLQGDPTAKYAGRLTLNPIAHIDPIGTALFVISSFMGMGFGWAKPVPVNPLLFKNYRTGNILVSIAGVAANFLQIIVGAIILKILFMTGILGAGPETVFSVYLQRIVIWFILFNLVLFVFNLVPIPPLDGSKLLMMLLPADQAMMIARLEPYGMIIIFGLLLTGVLGWVFGFAQSILMFFLNFFISL